MPTTQDIEAGLAPPGIGSPEPTPQLRLTPPPEVPYRPPTRVVDRQAYLTAQQQAAAQAQLDRIAELQRRYVLPILGISRQAQLDKAKAEQEAFARQYGLDVPGTFYEGATPLNAPPVGLTGLAQGIGAGFEGSPLAFDIPGAKAVQGVVGDVARNVANVGLLTSGGPLGTAVDIGVNKALGAAGLPQPSNIVRGALSNTAGFTAETLIPTEVWQAALELTPAGFTGGVPALARAVRKGSPEAIAALTRAGERLGAREEVQTALKQIGAEQGFWKFGKKTAEVDPAFQRAIEAQARGEISSKELGDIMAGRTTLKNLPIEAAQTGKKAAPEVAVAMPSEVKTALARRGVSIQQKSWEQLPVINREVITDMATSAVLGKERADILAAGRSRQVGAIQHALNIEGKSFAERQAIAGKGMEGNILPTFKPLGEKTILNDLGEQVPKYGPDEISQLTSQIDQAVKDGKISPYQWKQAGKIFENLMTAGKQLEPGERKLLGRIFGPEFEAAIPTGEKWSAWREAVGVIGLPQGLASTLDWSAVLRQMAPVGFAHPVEYVKAISTLRKATLSDKGAMEVMEETLKLPWVTRAPYPEAEGLSFADVGGRMSDIGGHLHESEGNFSALNNSLATRTLERLPWVKPSERAFNIPINVERGRVYSKWAQNMWDSGERDPKMYKAVADVIDHGTGWSNVKVGQVASGLNAFFSPRNMAARFQVLFDPFVQPGSLFKPSARQLAARNLVGFVGANAALLGLMAGSAAGAAKLLGKPNPVHVELDPRSTDMWKGRIGNTRVDFTGGYGSVIRLIARLAPLATGQAPQIKNSYGEIVDASPAQLIDDFISGKLGPIPKEIWNAMGFPGGQQFAHDYKSKEGLRTLAYDTLTPFFVQDVVEAWRRNNLATAGAVAPLAFLGAGVNTYESPNVAIDKIVAADPLTAQYQHYRDLPNDVKGEFNKRHPDEVSALRQAHEDAGRATFDKITIATNQGLADLGTQLKSGKLEPAEYRQAAGDFVHQQSIKFQQAITDAGLDQRDLTGDPKLLNDFFTAIDSATNQATGQTDFDKQSTLEDQYRSNLSTEQNQRLDQMLSYSSDETYHTLKQAKLTLAKDGYYDRSQAAFDAWKAHLPATAPVPIDQLHTPDDLRRWAMQDTQQRGIARQLYTRHPAYAAWASFYDDFNGQWLAARPNDDAIAVQWGYQDRVHSRAGANKYTELTGAPAPIPAK